MVNSSKWIAERVKNVPPSGIRKFFDLVADTTGVISLGVGEPDFITPWHIREAGLYSVEKGQTHYTSNQGWFPLRQEISKYVRREFGVAYRPEAEILITVGVSEALDLALRAVLDPDDEVIIVEPCYVSYKPCVEISSATVRVLETKPEDGFMINAPALERLITPKTKVLLLSYPNNPTGAVMPVNRLKELARIVEKHDLLVISDEIYHKLTYSGTHASLVSFPSMRNRCLLLCGFSKSFAMTGWRIGYACGPEPLIAAMCKIHQYTMLCAPTMGQAAALEALRNGENELQDMHMAYDARRKMLLKGLKKIGLACFEPQGAFYAFPSIAETGFSSEAFCELLLKEEKVAVVPGNAFGNCGEGFIRIAYAASLESIEEALRRMNQFLIKYRSPRKMPETLRSSARAQRKVLKAAS